AGGENPKIEPAPEEPVLSPAPLTLAELQATEDSTAKALEAFWDPARGGWGKQPKVPISGDIAWAMLRAKQGDATQKDHVTTMLARERAIMDPVWGGIYQYSVAPDWDHPHFEKLMGFNAGAIDNYAAAFLQTKNDEYLKVARSIAGYLEAFMLAPEGGFHGSQDADLNAHAPGKTFLDGHKYYAMDDAHRRALGIPRVDEHQYANDTGLALAGYATLYEATKDPAVLAVAARAANHILEANGSNKGGVTHDDRKDAHVLHLADNAAMTLGLVRLYEATHDPQWLSKAQKLADYMLKDFFDETHGAFYEHNLDEDAIGVFSARRKPFDDNVTAARAYEKLTKIKRDARYDKAIDRTLKYLSTPAKIADNGKFLGDFLLALEADKPLLPTK
ncbi:MAG: glycoside hydrolase family 88 protein, partial [Polyangiaceae bacterium]